MFKYRSRDQKSGAWHKKKSVLGIAVIQKDMGEVEAMGKNGGNIKKSSTENSFGKHSYAGVKQR